MIHIEGCIVSTALTQPRQRALLYPQVAKISGEILNRDLHCMEEISFFSWQQKVAVIQNPKWPPIHLLIPIFACAICTPSTLHFLWAWLQGNRQILLSGFFPLRGGVTPQCC